MKLAMGSSLATVGSLAASPGQFRWRSWSISVATVGRSLAFCNTGTSSTSCRMNWLAYASNLDALTEQTDLWIHGHMHESLNYRIGKCQVVCNPLGYKNRAGVPENQEFAPHFIVEI
jgi:hypothetical protein